jgi:uncharacterized membrane protein
MVAPFPDPVAALRRFNHQHPPPGLLGRNGVEPLWPIVVVVGLVLWLGQRRQIGRLAARVQALEARLGPIALPEPAVAEPQEDAKPAAPPALAPAPWRHGDIERRFGQRWIVWIGALALALGGVFVVQYSIEQDLIGPRLRILLGLLVGVVLVVAAEYLRKRPERLRLRASQTAQAASALAAGGVTAFYGVAWAAFGLYGLVGPASAMLAMAGAAAVALLLAWHHGALLAVLALLFAYLAPVLVGSDAPDPLALAGWLAAIQLVLALVLRFRPWSWLLAVDLLGLAPMTALLMLTGDFGIELAPFVAVAATVLPAWIVREQVPEGGRTWWRRLRRLFGLDGRAWIGGLLVAFTAIVASDLASLSPLPVPLLALGLLGASLLGRAPLHAAFAAAAVVVAVAAGMNVPGLSTPPIEVLGETVTATPAWRWLAPEHLPFARYSAAMAGLFFLAGWLGAARTTRPGGFAALAVTAPLALLAVTYGRIEAFAAAPRWTVAALLLAALFLVAAERSARRGKDGSAALAAFALGVVAALALALTMALETAWLTVALAAELLAVVLVHRRIPLPALAQVAAALAGIVAGRMIWQANDPALLAGGIPWALWAYAVPTALLAIAHAAGIRLVPAWTREVLLVAGVLAWIVAVMRIAAAWAGAAGFDDLLEPALQVSALSLTTLALVLRPPTRAVRLAALLAGLVALACLLVPLRRMADGESLHVLDLPVLNPLLLLLAVPALAIATALWRRGTDLPLPAARLLGGLALVLFLAWPVLEIRRGFTGSVVWGALPVQAAENWLYSAWLVVAAVGLLALGLARRQRDLRLASLAILVLAILKVFLLDLDGLEGLWRAAAFLGLGVTLVGTGLAYQRLFSDDGRATPAPGQ